MAEQGVFGGGGGKPGVPSAPIDPRLLEIFNKVMYKRYLIDPSGAAIEVAFDLVNKKVAIKTGEDINVFPYIEL